ncbi:MAG: helix-turn-helix domain-containing protein [Nitrospira sp.]|nr:helix-turn-helix domain-containing protein [Nitrospira sp.]
MDESSALMNKRLLRVDEAARLLNVSRWTVYRWVEAGQLGGTRIGPGSLRIFSDTVAALINHHSVGASVSAETAQERLPLKGSAGQRRRPNPASGMVASRRQVTV